MHYFYPHSCIGILAIIGHTRNTVTVISHTYKSYMNPARAVALHQEAMSYKDIESKTGVAKSTAQRWCKRFDATGSLHDKKRSATSRPRVVDEAEDERILESLMSTQSLRRAKIDLEATGNALSLSTIHRRATELAGVKSVRRKPLLTEKQQDERLEFALANLRRPKSFWRNVLFTDEKSYETFRSPTHVWVLKGDPAPQQPTVKRPPKLHIWAGISYSNLPQVRTPGVGTQATNILKGGAASITRPHSYS